MQKIKPFTIIENVILKDRTTIRIGGAARYYCEIKDESELKGLLIKLSKKHAQKVFVLGGGSDILISDKGFDGLVIKYLDDSLVIKEFKDGVKVTAGAGMIWDDLVNICVNKGLQGIECMSGIPGTVGASPVQNIGAYGQELKDSFYSLRAFNLVDKKIVEFNRKDCQFGYRESFFKKRENWQKYVITSVTLKLTKSEEPDIKYDSLIKYLEENNIKKPTLRQVRDSVLSIRSTKFEDYRKIPNAGSFFKNPSVNKEQLGKLRTNYPNIPCFDNGDGTYKCFAGWLIEQAGWKGRKLGNACVSPNHALIITNPSSKAKASEISDLARKIADDVFDRFGVHLESEVQYIE